jgi:hypothetical protein
MYGVMLVRDLLDRRTGTISLITGLIRVQHLMGATSQTLARHLTNPLHMLVVDIMDGTLVAGIMEVDVILQRE